MGILEVFFKYFQGECIFCKGENTNFDISPICDNCFNSIEVWGKACFKCGKRQIGEGLCGECLKDNNIFDYLYHIYSYEGKSKEVLNLYKFKGAWYLSKPFSIKILEFMENLPFEFKETPITYVPSHPWRIFTRNYNPVKFLLKNLKIYGNVEIIDLLKKIKIKKPQTSLKREKRLKNVKNTFKLKNLSIPKKVILFDDIYTTGSTLFECARVLKKGGVKNILGLTLARTP